MAAPAKKKLKLKFKIRRVNFSIMNFYNNIVIVPVADMNRLALD